MAETRYVVVDPLTLRALGLTSDPVKVCFVAPRHGSQYRTRETAECVRRVFSRTIPELRHCVIVEVQR